MMTPVILSHSFLYFGSGQSTPSPGEQTLFYLKNLFQLGQMPIPGQFV